MGERQPLVEVKNLVKHFPVRRGLFRGKGALAVRAVDDISFDIGQGETVGLVGESGCGKTTTGRMVMRLITPKRLKENEEFMWRLADQQLDTFVERGECEFLADYAKPFSLLVIADLLGVPQEAYEEFKAVFAGETVGELGKETPTTHNPLEWLNERFSGYIEDRRRKPRDDVMTHLALAKHEDGSTPDIEDVGFMTCRRGHRIVVRRAVSRPLTGVR